MELQNIFYGIAIFFAFITIIYFLSIYLEDVPTTIKAVLSFLLSAILFLVGDHLRRLDK